MGDALEIRPKEEEKGVRRLQTRNNTAARARRCKCGREKRKGLGLMGTGGVGSLSDVGIKDDEGYKPVR
jgi:hypothetical protein